MTVYDLKTMQKCEIKENTVVALGTFDGCHLGHAAVLRSAFYKAKANGIKCVAYTFDTSEAKGQELLLTLEEKIKAIKGFGIDYVAIEQFENIRSLSASEFVNGVLFDKLRAAHAACGFNYRFGKGASATALDLREFFENVGGSVDISKKITCNGIAVSSTSLREMVKNGDVEGVMSCMRPYSLYSLVESGKGMGKKMGFATINQSIPDCKVKPKTGVYITECEIGEDVYPAVTNVGYRPTTDGENNRLNV